MRKILSTIIALFVAQYVLAQWPANYGGVMMQAFYWDSYDDTSWAKLKNQTDEISKYFDVLWIPNSGNCGSGQSMGYMPVKWLSHSTSWGSETTLKNMIQGYNAKGTKVIMDVVINHKSPEGKNGSWIDFAEEDRTVTLPDGVTRKNYKLSWTAADICNNDDGGYTKSLGWDVTGADDTGDDFSGGRDLDHTSANVQQNVMTYLDFLQEYLGYSGFRLDMVKGYAPEYTKIYNQHAKPEFSVGEFWDGFDRITNWIYRTGDNADERSAAFDFPMKYKMNEAFGGGNFDALSDKGIAGSPDWNRWAVTFIDNHDTYENESRLVNNVLAAHAFMLTMPGTPCIFYRHWQKYPIAIGNMILARKACGITNQSSIVEQGSHSGGYITKVKGTKGTVLCISGKVDDYDTTGFKLIISGTNYAYYVSDNITVDGLREGNDLVDYTKSVTIYVKSAQAPHLYAWLEGGTQINGTWPGDVMTDYEMVDGDKLWKKTFNVAPVNIIFNAGTDNTKTQDIVEIEKDTYFSYDGKGGCNDITMQYVESELPKCIKYREGKLYAYFLTNKDYKKPVAWVWGNDNKNFCLEVDGDGNLKEKGWPGDEMKLCGYNNNNQPIYRWDASWWKEGDELPTGILFYSKSADAEYQTADFEFVNGGYYSASGYLGKAKTPITTAIDVVKTDAVKPNSAAIYNMQGQRVDSNYRGIVIKNGRKVVMK